MSAEQDLANANVQIANLISEVVRFRDAAMGLNAIYPTITEGRQTVADGKYFSVPGSGAYMRLYRRQGSSAELIAEFPDRTQVQGIVDVFAGRGVVGGSGDLMAQGAFGLGATRRTQTATTELSETPWTTGIYNLPNPAMPGAPTSNRITYLSAVWEPEGTNQARNFLAFENFAITGAVAQLHVATQRDDVISPWSRLLHNRNILGTVSQSDGVPTGAVIERGSNANGEYTVFADGFCRCMRRNFGVSMPSGNRYTASWTFPRSFSSEAHVGIAIPFSSTNYTDIDTRRNISATGAGGVKTSSALIEIYPTNGYTIPVGAEINGITLIAEGYVF